MTDVDSLLSLMAAEKYGESSDSDTSTSTSSGDSDSEELDNYQLPGDTSIWNSTVGTPSSWLQSVPTTDAHNSSSMGRHNTTKASDEVWRFKSMTFLRNKFDKSCREIDGLSNPPPQAFERWVFNCSLRPNSLPSWTEEADNALCTELKEAGAHPKSANGIAQQMRRYSNRANHTLNNAVGQSTKRHVVMSLVERETKTSSSSEKTTKTPPTVSTMVRLTYGKTKVHLTRDHFAKLLSMYRLNNHNSTEPTAPPNSYISRTHDNRSKKRPRSDSVESGAPRLHELDAIFTAVLRYNTLVGPQTQGAGFQAALNGECFDILLKHFGVRMECFASPLNSRYRNFCSAYWDTDSLFGSQGSFFQFFPKRGSFEANPPFVGHVMQKMVTHMLSLLERATTSSEPLQFIIIIPCWKNDLAHQRLESRCGPHMRHHLVIPQRSHGYTEGAQWSKADSRFRISTCDTSVFFLQTPKAATKWTITSEKLNDLKRSFRSKHRKGGNEKEGNSDSGDSDGSDGSGDSNDSNDSNEDNQERNGLHIVKVDPFKSRKRHKKN
jgi:hypothetical protein